MFESDMEMAYEFLQILEPEACLILGQRNIKTIILNESDVLNQETRFGYGFNQNDAFQSVLLVLQIVKSIIDLVKVKKERSVDEIIFDVRKFLKKNNVEDGKIADVCSSISSAIEGKNGK